MPRQQKASFAAQAIARQNILQALISQARGGVKYLSPKLFAVVLEVTAELFDRLTN